MPDKINYIARLDLRAFLRVTKQVAVLRQAFDRFSCQQGLRSGETLLTVEVLDQAEREKGASAAERLLREAVFQQTALQEEQAQEAADDLFRGLTNTTFETVPFADILGLIAPEFELVGIPFALVKEDISTVQWDPEAGVPGVWRRLEPGRFLLGEPEKGRVINVSSPFLISVFLFTNGQALAVAGGREICQKAAVPHRTRDGLLQIREHYGKLNHPYYFRTEYVGIGADLDHPIPENLGLPLVGISGETAQLFAMSDGDMLPSEAQWEYAARYNGPRNEAGVVLGYRYPTGPSLIGSDGQFLAHVAGHGREWKYTAPVGSYSREEGSGIYDMAGNVMEWTNEGNVSRGGFWSRGPLEEGGDELLTTHCRHLGPQDLSTYIGLRPVINLAA